MKKWIWMFSFLMICSSALAAVAPNIDESGMGIKGYDPVALLDNGTLVKGEEGVHFTYLGARYHFLNMDNKVAFVINKDRYIPRYGGWCAFAVSKGQTADIDPQTFSVYKDKLYFNANMDVKALWEAALETNISIADTNWISMNK